MGEKFISQNSLSKKQDIINKILMCLIVIVPILLVFQGFDLDDTGTHIYNAIHLFDEGKVISSATVFSNILTYLCYKIFGGFGLISLFIFNSLIIVLISFVCYKLVQNCIPKTISLVGVLVAQIVSMRFIHIVNYNTYSVMLIVLCCMVLYYGIVKQKNLYLFLAGLCTGISIFVRLPNICLVVLGIGLIYWALATKMPFKKFLLKAVVYFCGIAAAVLCVMVIIIAINKLTPATVTMIGVKGAVASEGSYSFWGLVDGYIHTFLAGLEQLWFIFIPIALLICDIICTKIKNQSVKIILHIIFISLNVISIVYFAYCGFSGYILPVFCWLSAFIIIAVSNTEKYLNRELSLLCIISAIATIIPFAGSNTGITHANLSLGIILPIVIYAFYKLYKHFDLDRYSKTVCKVLALGFALVFCYNNLVLNITTFDLKDRSEVVYSINSKKVRGLHTNKFRADFANDVIDVISELDNEYMIVYPGYDMLYYLTDKSSYVGKSGMFFDSYSAEQLKKDIYSVEDKSLPIILLSNIRPYACSSEDVFTPDKKQKIIEEFMDKNSYTSYYTDENISVYVPQ